MVTILSTYKINIKKNREEKNSVVTTFEISSSKIQKCYYRHCI